MGELMQIWLFDIDGTLVQTGGAGYMAMVETMARQFGTAIETQQVEFSGRTDLGITGDLFSSHAIEVTEETVQRFHALYLQQLPSSLSRHTGCVLPGVREWLLRIEASTFTRLGLLTGNLEEAARQKLAYYGLWEYFHFGGFGDLHTDRNEVAAAALAAAEAHIQQPVDQCEVWVVGDTPRDVQCARSIGAKVIAVATGIHPLEELADSNPDLLVPDLSDISPLMELLTEA